MLFLFYFLQLHMIGHFQHGAKLYRFYADKLRTFTVALQDIVKYLCIIQILGNYDFQFLIQLQIVRLHKSKQQPCTHTDNNRHKCRKADIAHADCQSDCHGEKDEQYLLTAAWK